MSRDSLPEAKSIVQISSSPRVNARPEPSGRQSGSVSSAGVSTTEAMPEPSAFMTKTRMTGRIGAEGDPPAVRRPARQSVRYCP
jgi:hypothetical protein